MFCIPAFDSLDIHSRKFGLSPQVICYWPFQGSKAVLLFWFILIQVMFVHFLFVFDCLFASFMIA